MPAKKQKNRLDALTQRLNQWSRGARIGMNTFVTLMFILVVGFIVDRLLLRAVYEERLSVWVPTLIISALGVVIYAGGWFLLVGYDWDAEKPWQARRASTLFVLSGLFAFGVIILAVVGGLVFVVPS